MAGTQVAIHGVERVCMLLCRRKRLQMMWWIVARICHVVCHVFIFLGAAMKRIHDVTGAAR